MQLQDAIAATAALGPAAYGVVDACKVLWGGPSRFGLGAIRKCLRPFRDALAISQPSIAGKPAADTVVMNVFKANWLNGVPLADQKAKAKSLIHLGLTPATATSLAAATGMDAAVLTALANKIAAGTALAPEDVMVLGRFDTIVATQIDTGFERADQIYRNAAKALAAVVAVGGAVLGAQALHGEVHDWVLIGLAAVPLAPVSKDLSTAVAAIAGRMKS